MKQSKAFSLIELIIVVLLISMVGFLTFSEAVKKQQKVEVLDPSKLPKIIRKTYKGQGDIEFFCIKKAQECYIAKGKTIEPFDGNIELGKNVEIYKLDEDNHLVQIDEFGRVQDKKISLRFHLYPNGSTTQMILSNDQGIYYLPSYFGEAKEVSDMEEAKSLWIKEEYDLKDSGSFF